MRIQARKPSWPACALRATLVWTAASRHSGQESLIWRFEKHLQVLHPRGAELLFLPQRSTRASRGDSRGAAEIRAGGGGRCSPPFYRNQRNRLSRVGTLPCGVEVRHRGHVEHPVRGGGGRTDGLAEVNGAQQLSSPGWRRRRRKAPLRVPRYTLPSATRGDAQASPLIS